MAGEAGAAQCVFDAQRTAPHLRCVGGAQMQPADAAFANRFVESPEGDDADTDAETEEGES